MMPPSQIVCLRRPDHLREFMPQGRELKMLTTHRIQEHFEFLEMDRLRAEVKELQSRVSRLEEELHQCRRNTDAESPAARVNLSNGA